MAEAPHPRPGRNEPCHCGSGKKYKHCCLAKDEEADRASRLQQAAAAPPPPPPPPAEETMARPTLPPRVTPQPWRRATQRAPGNRKINTPRKAG
jgi:hypothetical protein